MSKYWYLTITEECPVCGRGETTKERQYTPRPEDDFARYIYEQVYDWCNE